MSLNFFIKKGGLTSVARKNQPAYKSTAGKKINTKWLNNVMKSIGSTTMDSFKTIAPNLYSAGEGIASSVRDIRNMTVGNSIGKNVTNLSKNKYINYGKRAFDNIIDDLKTGNLNNTERMNQAMDDSFGNMFDDFSFGDEEEGASVTFNYMGDSKQSSDATFELAKSIQKSGEANVKAQKATVDAMISVTSASMLQQQEIGKETNAHLGNINNNIAALVAYQQENTTKFYESAMAVFDRFLKKEEEESSGGDKATRLFNSNGGINPSAYKDYVKKQISSSLKDSNLGSMANMILSDDTAMEMVVSNPIGFASKMIVQGMVPHLVTNTIKGMEEAFTGFMPTMIAKLGEWRHNEEKGLAGTIKRLIGNVFGIEVEKLDKIDLSGKVTKDAAIFDGMTRNSIVEVIPKHLREMSSYLRDIAEHFKVDTTKSRQQAEIFDAGSGKYISIQELQKNIAEKVTNSVTDAMSSTEFGKSIAGGGNDLVGKDAKTYERMTKQMYEFMSRMDGAFTPESFNVNDKDSKINQILGQIDVNNKQEQKVLNVLTETIKILGENQKGLHHSQFAAMRGIEAKNDTLTSLGKDYDIENLIAAGITSETDINEFVDMYGGNKKAQQNREKERERKKREEKAKEKRDYKNRRKGSARSLAKHSLQEAGIIHRNDTKNGRERISADNADASTLPGFIANTGGHLKDSMFAAMNGDNKGAIEALGAIFTDGMKTLWGSIKDNFLNPLKESIFGKKGEDGYIDGGLFSGVQNKAKDIWKEIGFHINGKEYTDSAGNKHEADPENSVVGRVKGIFGTITDSIKYRLFGDKDEEGKDDKKKGNVVGGIIDTFKEGLLGWKHALFGDDPEKDADQQISDFKEKAMKAIPDLGVGAIGGLAMSQLSGGLLGAIIGGPFTGIALGMGTSLLAKSEKFQNYLFGPEVEDEEGNKSRVGGLISKKTQDMFKDPAFKKSAIGGAALGIAKSFIFGSSGGILGSLVGGPIAGAIFGAGLGMLKKSEMFQNFMYGEIGEDGERSGGFKDKLKAKIKSTFGKDNKEDGEDGKKMKKAFGMGALGAGAGGVMGLLMGGPIVGSVIGLASGIAASTGKFKKWFFGEKDEDGNVTKVGMLGKVGNWMHTEIMAPMKNKVLDIVEDFKTTIKYDVFNVAKILMGPAVDYVKESVDKVKEKFSQGLDYVKEKLFAPIGKLASTIMKPVKKAVGAVVSFAYKQVKRMVTLPFKVMKHVALAITSPFVKLAKGVKKIIGWVGKKIFNAIGFVTKKAFKLVAAPFNVAAGIANYLGGKAKDKLAGVGGEVRKKKHVKGEGWRVDLKNNKIDKENELRENKKNRRERANMAYNRSLVAKTLGYDVKYLTEENYEAALKVDKKLARKMKGPGFGRLGDKSKRQFEEDPAEVARKQQAKIAKSSDADIATMDTKDQDIGTRNLIQSTRQTSILERIFNWLTGKKSKFGDSYGNVTDGGDAKDDQTAEGNKKPEDQNEEAEEENIEEDNRKWYEKISDEISESGGVLNWAKGKLTSAKDKVKGFFSKDSIKEGFENSDLNRAIQKVKGFFGSKNRTRAKGGPVEKGKSYLVGDGGTDPSAAEVFVPKTNGKILSQKNGGIKVTIEGIATKAIQAIKSIFTGGPGNILPGQSGGPNLVGNDDSSDSVSLARASVNANAEADYDEEGNLIKEKVDSETIDDIEDEDEKEDAIVAADNAADLANAKNAGSFISQRKKKEEAKNEENAKTQIDLLDKIRSGQEKANKEQKSHFNIWESVFSKKGLITAAILGLFAIFPNLPGTIVEGLFNAVKAIGKSLGLQIEGELEKNAANGGIGKNTDGNNAAEEVQETIDNITDGNILDLQKDGSASKTSSSILKVLGRAGLNWKNRYFTKGNSKTTKRIKKVMRGVETVVKTPGRVLNRVINGKPTEYEKVIRDSKKNKLTYDKKNKRWIDNYNREVLSQDQWDELVKENGDDWAKANKDKYYLPDDKTSPKNPKQGKVSKKISEIKEGAKTKLKETKPAKKVAEFKENLTTKAKNSKPGQALEKGRTKIQNAQEAVKGKIDDAKGAVKGKFDDAKGAVKGKFDDLKNTAKDKFTNAVSGKTDDIMKAGAEKADDAIEATTKKLTNKGVESDGWFKKVTGMVSDFFKSLFEKIAKASGKNADDLVKVTSKFGFKNIKAALKKVWDKTAGKLIGFITGKIGAASVTFGLSELVGLGISAIDGATCAAKLFEVSKEDVDGTMTLISTAWGALTGTTVGGLFDLVCSVLEPFMGKIQKFICVAIYTFIKGSDSEDVKALGENQKKFRVEWEKDRDAKLKKEYETQQKAGIIGKDVTFEQFLAGVKDGTYKANAQSFEDYNTNVNGGLMDKTIDAVGGGITTAAHAVGTWWSGDTKYQDDKGNVYTKTKTGDWQVTDKDGKDLGTVNADAIDPKKMKDVSTDGAWGAIKSGAGAVVDGAKKFGGAVADGAGAVIDAGKNLAGKAVDTVKNVGSWIGGMFGFGGDDEEEEKKKAEEEKRKAEEAKKKKEQEEQAKKEEELMSHKYEVINDANKTYWQYDKKTKKFLHYTADGKIIQGESKTTEEITQLVKDNVLKDVKIARRIERPSSLIGNLLNVGKAAIDSVKKDGLVGTAKKAGSAVMDGAKKLGGKLLGGIKNIFGFGGDDEEEKKKKAEEEKRKAEEAKKKKEQEEQAKKEEELMSHKYEVVGDKNKSYWQYDKKTKKFLHYKADGKVIEGESKTTEEITQLVKDKKLKDVKIATKLTEKKKETGFLGRLINVGKAAINSVKKDGLLGTAKKVGSAAIDTAKKFGGKLIDAAKKGGIGGAVKTAVGTIAGGIKKVGGKLVGGIKDIFSSGSNSEMKKAELIMKSKFEVVGDKNKSYWKYDPKAKKFYHYTSDGKKIEKDGAKTAKDIADLLKEKKLTIIKPQTKQEKKKEEGFFGKLINAGKNAINAAKKGGIGGALKNAVGTIAGGIKKVGGKLLGGVKKSFGLNKNNETKDKKKKSEEILSSHKYMVVGDKKKSYWKYDPKAKKFYHYSADGKKIEKDKGKSTEEIFKLLREKKLKLEKIPTKKEKKKEEGFFGKLINAGKNAINAAKKGGIGGALKDMGGKLLGGAKNLIKKTPIGKAISFGKKMVGKLTDKLTKEQIYRDPKDKTYWKYDAKEKVYYKYNVNNQKTDDKPKTQKQIDKLFKEGKLVKDTIKKDNVLTRSIDAVKKLGKKAIDSAKKTFSAITGKATKKSTNKSIKPERLSKIGKRMESGKDYIYYAKKDKSYYACVGGKWYHFNKDGQKLDEKEVSYSYIFSKFSNGDLVRDKISGKTKITNEKDLKKYIKSLSKNAKKNDWETKKELDKKLEKQNKGKTKPKKRKTKKVFMSPDGDYYKKNKDGTYNHYNSIGNLIDENIDGEDKDKIEKKIKNGTLVSSEISEKKKVDASKVHGGINKTVNSVWKESQKNLEGNTNTVTGAVTGTATKSTSSTTSPAKSGIFGLAGSIFSGIFGGGFSNEDDEIGGAGGDELNGFKFFSQKDKRWKDKDYSSGKSKSTMGKAGCGPTAMSMVASQLSGKNLSPVDIAADAKNAGFRDKTGTNANFISYESKKLNLPSVQTQNPSAEYIVSELDKGHPMILNGISPNEKNSPYTRKGHYIVAVGRDDNGNIRINDPRGKSKSKSISPEKLAKETRLGWSFKKNRIKRFITKKTGGYGEKDWIGTVRSVHKAMSDAGRKNGWKYDQGAYHNIKVDNKTYNVRWDCSGFVSACLEVYGSFKKGQKTNSTGFVNMKNLSGFTPMNWCGWDKLQEGDIIARNGHVEIFAYNKKGKHFVYNAGSTEAINATEPSGSSHSDYTRVLRPDEPGEGVELQTDTASSDATTSNGSETNTDPSNGFLDNFQALASEYANRVMKGDYNSDFSSVLSGDPNSSDDSSNASGETASAATEIEGNGNIEKVWNFFAKNGFSAAAISGIIGNMYQESGVNPKSIQGNGKGPAAGIFQWENYNTKSSRWKALDNKARKEGKDWKDLGVQLDFALGEMKGKDIDNRLKGKYGIINNGKSRETTDIDGKKYTLNAISDGFEGFKQIADVEEAVKSFEAAYERAGKPNFKRRIDKAKEVYKKYGKEASTTDEGGSGGFGDYGDEMDIFTSTYKTSSNTTMNTNSTSDDKLIKLLSGDHSEINRLLNKSTSEEKMEKLLEKMVSILESISDSSSSSITELKKIAANSKMNGQYNTNIVNGGGTNNIIQNGSGQPSSESRNSVLARQLAKG